MSAPRLAAWDNMVTGLIEALRQAVDNRPDFIGPNLSNWAEDNGGLLDDLLGSFQRASENDIAEFRESEARRGWAA
jgi:hypothetical protein